MSEQPRDGAQPFYPLAEEILSSLRECPEAGDIILGGYFALKQYLDYRATHDLDAWWRTGRTEGAVACIQRVMRAVADRHGLRFAQREWGETLSFELADERRKIFSFQIAVRSLELEPPRKSAWEPVLVESLADNVGSKMNALVQRGAPRDFVDIMELVTRGIVSLEQCWDWWARKNPGIDLDQARAQALRHLQALGQRRPLAAIADAGERAAARRARAWIRRTLLRVPADPDHDV
ncbi:MAG: hypothetical protein HY703_12515 [Gemmatimonadetes bacterium]|nr:hypothetical protein [Gemmatimonadota bacterium]